MEQPSRLPKKRELFIIAGILALALLLFFVFGAVQRASSGGSVARIVINGEEVQTIDLTRAPDQTIGLAPWGAPVVLEIKDHQIRFASSDCPDQICVKGGFIHKELQTLVCMPNRTVVVIESTPAVS